MAENVNITPGTGDIVAADDISGVKHQRVKISQGVDGSATDVSATDPLNVTLANTGANSTAIKVDNSAVTQPVSGTVTSNAGTGTRDTNLKQVNGITTQTGTGTAGTGTQRVAVASDSSIQLTDGTNTANVLKSDGTAAGQNSQMVSGTYLSVPFSTTTVQAVGTTDVGNYATVSVQITSQGTSSTVNFQTSNDNVNWTTQNLNVTSSPSSFLASTSSTVNSYYGALTGRYFRLNVTGISAGTTAGTIIFSTISKTVPSQSMNIGASTSTGSAVPANAFYIAGNAGGNLSGINSTAATLDALSPGSALWSGAAGYMYNGTNWDRMRGTTTDGLQTYIKGTATDNGLTASKVIAAATTNATSVKASAGKIYRIDAFNSDTVGYWVKFYNKASAPTVGTDVPVATKYVPPGGGFVIESTIGIPYTTGIALATTVNATDADTTAVTNANKLVINLRYV